MPDPAPAAPVPLRLKTCRWVGTNECPHLQDRTMGIAISMTSFGEQTMRVVVRSFQEGRKAIEDVERRLCAPCSKFQAR